LTNVAAGVELVVNQFGAIYLAAVLIPVSCLLFVVSRRRSSTGRQCQSARPAEPTKIVMLKHQRLTVVAAARL